MMNFDSPYTLSYFDGIDLVAVMQVYADASQINGHLSVGAVLFRKKHIAPFEKEWRAMLRHYDLPYFHMTECNAGVGVYSALSDQECDDCARRAIKIILKYAANGTIFSVKEEDFYEIITKRGVVPNPFTLGAWRVLFDVAHWADDNDPSARISYVFESGDDHQSDANILFESIAEDPERCARFRYRGHAFLPKRTSLPTQAADIFAWHGAKHAHRRSCGNDRLRGDFQAIIDQLRVGNAHHDRSLLREIVAITERHAGARGNEIAGIAFRHRTANERESIKQISKIIEDEKA